MNPPAIHGHFVVVLLIFLLCCGNGSASDDLEEEFFFSEIEKALDLHDKGRTDSAVRLIDDASETYLHTNWSYYVCGYIISYMGEDERALPHFDKALEVDPTYARAWYYKGKSLSGLGRTQEAEACFLRAEELDPQYQIPWTDKWPISVIFRNMIPIYMALTFGLLGIYIIRRERLLRR
ncbi:hypothetical protein MKMG_00948 [Methanogenium sp. MK-MG]|nr:hypothetical protein MKMG_00948 [Methanogenium sp. MK-MG]